MSGVTLLNMSAPMNRSATETSHHILPTSANLLGVCFLIFSLVKTSGKSDVTLLDDLAIAGILIFLASSVLSYLSLRIDKRNKNLERSADLIFIFGLVLLAVTSIIVAVEVRQ